MKVTLTDNIKNASKVLERLPREVNKATAAALNRVGPGVKTELVRQITKKYAIKSKDVKSFGKIKVTKANYSKLEVIMSAKGNNIPLIRFSTNPSTPKRVKVVKASVKKGGKKPIPGAFVTSLGKYTPGVFRRTGPGRRDEAEQLRGPAVPIMANEPQVIKHLATETQRRLGIRIDHEMNRMLGRLNVK